MVVAGILHYVCYKGKPYFAIPQIQHPRILAPGVPGFVFCGVFDTGKVNWYKE
jgi:hypothetical protein